MNTADNGVEGLPHDLPIMQTYERIQEEFPGGPLPAVVVVEADDAGDPALVAASEDLREQALATGLMNGPVDTTVNPDGTVRRRSRSRLRATARMRARSRLSRRSATS